MPIFEVGSREHKHLQKNSKQGTLSSRPSRYEEVFFLGLTEEKRLASLGRLIIKTNEYVRVCTRTKGARVRPTPRTYIQRMTLASCVLLLLLLLLLLLCFGRRTAAVDVVHQYKQLWHLIREISSFFRAKPVRCRFFFLKLLLC